jgi:hypothetical protein
MRQKCILLRLVEAMDLVNEEYRLASQLQTLLSGGNYFANASDSLGHGREWDELAVSVVGDEPADRGLPRAGRPPEDHRGYRATLDRFAERFPRIE